MELLGKANAIRIQNHKGAYVVANDDKSTVGESDDGSSPSAKWLVERVHGKPNVVRLKSRFGLYLTPSDGKLDWEPIPNGVKFKSRDDKLLQANAEPKSQNWAVSLMRWVGELLQGCCEPRHHERNSGATVNWVFWHVEAMPLPDRSDANSSSSYVWLQQQYVLTDV